MSNHPEFNDMNNLNDFEDLEAGLRRKRPLTDPPREAFKRRLRADLMERIDVNEKRIGFKQLLSMAGAALLVVAIPLFFWLSLRPQFQAAGPAANPTETAAAVGVTPPVSDPYPADSATAEQPLPEAEELSAYPGPQPTAVPTSIPTATPFPLGESTVSISEIGEPQPHEFDGQPSPFKQVEVQLAYTLYTHTEGLIVLEWHSADGLVQARDQIGVLAGEGETTITLLINPDQITADGALRDDLVFTPHLWGLETESGQYTHLAPAEAADTAQPPQQPYYAGIHRFAYDETAAEVSVALNYQIQLPQEVSATVSLLDEETTIISQTVPLDPNSSQVDLILPLADGAMAEQSLTLVWALDTAERPLSRSFLSSVVLAELNKLAPNSLKVLSTDSIEQDDMVFVTFLVAFDLSEPYTAGAFSSRSTFHMANNSGGGGDGGGGGGQPLEPGSYARIHTTSFPAEALGKGESWEDVLEVSFELIGETTTGEQTILDSYVNIP